MGNANVSHLETFSCYGGNLSRNSITPVYWNTHSISKAIRDGSIGTATIILLFVLIGSTANFILIASIIYKRLYRNATHILLLNLGIADLLICLLVLPPIVITGFVGSYIFGDSDYVRCQMCQTGLINTIFTVFDVNVLGLLSVDRFIYIKFPLSYNKIVTIRRTILIVIVLWIVCLLESILPLFGFGAIQYSLVFPQCTATVDGETRSISNIYYYIFIAVFAIPPIAAIIVTNIWIFCIVHGHIRRVYENKKDASKVDKKAVRKRKSKKQMVLARSVGGILVSHVVCWIPLVFLSMLYPFIDYNVVPLGILLFVFTSFTAHSVVHPIIEGCILPEIKEVYLKIFVTLHCVKKKRRNTDLRDRDKSVEKSLCCCCCKILSTHATCTGNTNVTSSNVTSNVTSSNVTSNVTSSNVTSNVTSSNVASNVTNSNVTSNLTSSNVASNVTNSDQQYTN